ncbi:hypothetical protein BaRGS_00004922, partial [Batillaria attramentaria]
MLGGYWKVLARGILFILFLFHPKGRHRERQKAWSPVSGARRGRTHHLLYANRFEAVRRKRKPEQKVSVLSRDPPSHFNVKSVHEVDLRTNGVKPIRRSAKVALDVNGPYTLYTGPPDWLTPDKPRL